jgi:hypothetical protein
VSACTELLRDSNRLIEARTRQDERELLATGAKPSQAIDERGDCQGSAMMMAPEIAKRTSAWRHRRFRS